MDGEFRLHYWKGPDAWLNQRLCHFKPRPSIPPFFLGESLRSPLEFVERSEAATTVIHLGKYDIDRFRLVRADDRVLAAFGSLTTPILALAVQQAAESRKLAQLRDYLLPKLLSGEVRVREVTG
jgi:type I restriction enzyme S subunit